MPAHREAFCLMNYASADGAVREVIWNSRDGVTPFIVRSRGGVEMRHVEWHRDIPAPNHVPKAGDRIFVDLTEERALELRRLYVARFWDPGDHGPGLRNGYESKEDAVRILARADLEQHGGGNPDMVEVTAEMATKFSVLAQLRGDATEALHSRLKNDGVGPPAEEVGGRARLHNGDEIVLPEGRPREVPLLDADGRVVGRGTVDGPRMTVELTDASARAKLASGTGISMGYRVDAAADGAVARPESAAIVEPASAIDRAVAAARTLLRHCEESRDGGLPELRRRVAVDVAELLEASGLTPLHVVVVRAERRSLTALLERASDAGIWGPSPMPKMRLRMREYDRIWNGASFLAMNLRPDSAPGSAARPYQVVEAPAGIRREAMDAAASLVAAAISAVVAAAGEGLPGWSVVVAQVAEMLGVDPATVRIADAGAKTRVAVGGLVIEW